MKTPETSRLFEKWVDPVSGVESYILSRKITRQQQGFYFTNDCMTEDGRYLWFYVGLLPGSPKMLGVVDFEADDLWIMEDTLNNGSSPYVDTKTGEVYFTYGATVYRRAPQRDAQTEKIGTVPSQTGAAIRFCSTHLTRTPDGKEFFLDLVEGVNTCYTGTMDIETGVFTKWADHALHTNHGQINPQNPDLALCACDYWTNHLTGEYNLIPSDENGNYLRLWTVTRDGKQTTYPPHNGFATHEYWSADGKKIFYNNFNGIQRINLETGAHECVHPTCAWHSFATADEKYFVYDAKKTTEEAFYRGGPACVRFVEAETNKEIDVISYLPPLGTPEEPFNYHPDPHPRFVCGEKYVVYTTTVRGTMDVAVVKVDHLIKKIQEK